MHLFASSLRNMATDYIKFKGHNGCYGCFDIILAATKYEAGCESIIVVHEGNWTENLNNPYAWPECQHYEDAQVLFGRGLIFVDKEYLPTQHATAFKFAFDSHICGFCRLVVPATGEDFFFKVYGIRHTGERVLLIEMEL